MKKRLLHLMMGCIISLTMQPALAKTIFPQNSSLTGSFAAYHSDTLQLTTDADGRIDLTLTSTGGTIVVVSLYAEDGTTSLGGFNTGAGPVSWSRDGLAAGNYIMKLTEYYENQPGSFALSNHLVVAPVVNDVEPDDDYLHAQTFAQNDVVHGHIFYFDYHHSDGYDWYKLKLNSDGMLKLTLTNNSNNGHIVSATLVDSSGNINNNFGGFNTASTNTFIKDGLAAGTYYIMITTYYQNGDYAAYTLADSLFIYKNAGDAEPNNAPYQATTLNTNATVTGHEGFANTKDNSDGADWYKLNYTGTGDLAVTFNQEPHLSDNKFAAVEYRLYKDTSQGSIYFTTLTTASSTANLNNLTPGMYWIQVNPSVNYLGFGSYSITDSFKIPLPVIPFVLLNFDVTRQDKNALLTWSVSNEPNSKGYEIEKSADGLNFTDLEFVNIQTSSGTVHSYSFTDPSILTGTSYYRLKQTDILGHTWYSPVVVLPYTKLEWTVSGNATTGTATVRLQLDKTSDVFIQIISARGSIITTMVKRNLLSGTYSYPLEFRNVAAGTYIIRTLINGQAYTKMIIK
jgi:hypothetical protein